MKINKKLLMAALAGAIVVTGGVGSYAADEGIPAPVEDKGPGIFDNHEYKPSKDEEKSEENEGIPAPVEDKGPGIFDDHEYKPSDDEKEDEETPEKPEVQNGFETEKEAIAAAKKALENNKMNNTYSVRQGADGKYYYVLGYEHKPLVTIDEWLANNTPEEEGKISDNWYDQSKHPFEEGKEDGKTPDVTPTPGETTPSTPAEPSTPEVPSTPGETTPSTPGETTPSTTGKTTPSTPGEGQKPEEGKPGKEEKPEKEDKPAKEEKENTDSPNKKEKEENGKGGVDSPKKKEKAALPKAGSAAEILTLAAASLSSVAGAFISLKKRK